MAAFRRLVEQIRCEGSDLLIDVSNQVVDRPDRVVLHAADLLG
jgi:hypothetical protein